MLFLLFYILFDIGLKVTIYIYMIGLWLKDYFFSIKNNQINTG